LKYNKQGETRKVYRKYGKKLLSFKEAKIRQRRFKKEIQGSNRFVNRYTNRHRGKVRTLKDRRKKTKLEKT
jgi:hypothetical protein